MLRCDIDWSCQCRILTSYAGNVDYVPSRVVLAVAEEMGNGELGDTDRVCQVEIEQPIAPACRGVSTLWRAWRAPEIAPVLPSRKRSDRRMMLGGHPELLLIHTSS